MVGFGAEVDLEYFDAVKPFVRFTGDVRVAEFSGSSHGKLTDTAYMFATGIHVSVADVHILLGRDFAGGFSPGIGIGIGWMY